MSYHIYSTEGIILKRIPQGEASATFYILTEKFGLIIASARSVRVMVSKLRPALQEFENINLSCIKGKNGWKVTNVVSLGSYFFESQDFAKKILAQISSFLMRTITGELPHPKIFETVKSGFEFLRTLNKKEVSNFEVLIMLRILFELGYVEKNPDIRIYLDDLTKWSTGLLEKIEENKLETIAIINKALKESHL